MTATTIRVQMAQRKDTAANWTSANPILLSGEIGYETDTKKFKIGNGSSNWNSLAYLPIPDGSGNLTITGNLEIGTTGSLTFEGSTANAFETTLAVTDPTADRTITLPDRSGTVITSGDTGTVTSTMLADGTIVNADISATAEIAVSKLANGTANQIITTDGTDVSWSSNLNLAGNATIQGDLTVNGTTTTIDTQTLLVEDKNIEMGVVATPTDVTADGGGITLRGTTNKTINWVDATDAWTSSERFSVPLGSGGAPSLTFTGDPNTGIYSPGADQVAISTNGTNRIEIQADGDIDIDNGGVFYDATNNRLAIGTTSPTEALEVAGNAFLSGDNRTLRISTGQAGELIFAGAVTQSKVSHNSGALQLTTTQANGITFTTNSSERARIDSSGRLLVGTSSGSYKFQINALGSGGFAFDDTNGVISNTFGTGGGIALRAQVYSSAGGGEVYLGGSTRGDANRNRVVCTPGSNGVYLAENATSWTASSDERKKTDLIPIDDALGKVGTLRAVTGRYLTDAEGTSRSFLIAQDVQAVLPEAVDTSDPDSLGVSYTDVIPLLVAALKESKEHIEQLEAEMAAVKAQLS